MRLRTALNDWKEKQRYLEEALIDDQKKPLLTSILLVNVMKHLLKTAAMSRDVNGSCEGTREGTLGVPGHD